MSDVDDSQIRLARVGDAARLVAIYGPFCEETIVSFETKAPTVEEMAARVAALGERYPWLVWEPEGFVAGYAYASAHRDREAYQWSVNVTVYLDAAHRGQGVGRRLYTALFEILRKQGFYTACAGITLPNAASERLHRSMGFSEIGIYREVGFKLGAWHDTLWLQRELQPKPPNPEPPRPLSEAVPGLWERG